jgi:hypothetical protein
LLPFFEHYNWGCDCHTSVIMTLWPTHISIHDITTKYPKSADPRRLSKCNLFSWNTSHLHNNLEESLRVLFFTHSLTVDLVH